SAIFFFFQAEDGIRDRNVTGVQTCALPISLCSTPQPVPATTRKPCSSITDCSCFASWGKYPQGPVSITEKPASAISASAVRQWIWFSSSVNHTPHWSWQTPMVSLSNGGSGLRDLSMRVVEASVVVMTLLLRRSSEMGRAGSVVSREAHGALDGLVLGGPAGGDGLLLGVEADALGAMGVVLAEQGVLPAAEGVVAHRGRDRYVDADHAHGDLLLEA